MAKKYTQEEFITKAISVHGDKYSYINSEYINTHKEFRYKGNKIMRNGNSELFTKDILNLDIINTYT